MIRTVQQLVASYVVLCLAFAGAVGISPVLHQLVEHGGHGKAHLHFGVQVSEEKAAHHPGLALNHVHQDGPVHHHQEPIEQFRGTGLFVHNVQGFHAPGIFSHVWRLVARIVDRVTPPAPDSPPAPDQNGHDHHSLAQLIASGLVELSIDLPRLDTAFLPIAFGSFPTDALFLANDWDAQTASRGPPTAGLNRV